MPFFNTRTGDRPQFPLTNERLDKPDLAAIADYLNETLVRMLGALLGPSSGALSPVTFDFSTPGQVEITNRCFFAYAWPEVPGDFGTLQGGVVIHDPARESQLASLIDLTEAVVDQDAWIWFQRIEVTTHTATRRNWVAGAEATAPALTLMEEAVTFHATTTTAHATINEANGFFKFAAVDADDWAANAPTIIRVINFPNGGDYATAAYLDNGTVTEFQDLTLTGATGIAKQLRWLFAKVSQIMDSDNTFNTDTVPATVAARGWADDPAAGLYQLSAADAAMQADITALQAEPYVLHTVTLTYMGPGAWVDSGAGICPSSVAGVSPDATACIVSFAGPPAGYVIHGIYVSKIPLASSYAGFTSGSLLNIPLVPTWVANVGLPFVTNGAAFDVAVKLQESNTYTLHEGSFTITMVGVRV